MNALLHRFDGVRGAALHALRRLAWLPPLVARLTLGIVFVLAGWEKVKDLAKVTAAFEGLHIPAPAFNAALVGYSELICGALLLVGLISRLATIPLMVTMVVALVTAKAKSIHSVAGLFGSAEFCLLVLLLIVAVSGPGLISLDALFSRWLAGRSVPRLKPTRAFAPVATSRLRTQ